MSLLKPTVSSDSAERLTAQTVRALIPLFKKKLGARFVLHQPEELAVYDCDGSALIAVRPDLVVLPKTTDDVVFIVQTCVAYNIPYIARGAGTGLSGGTLALSGGVVVGLNRMDQIRAIDPLQKTATIQAGVINADLNKALAPYQLFYAPDPSSQSACTMGGNMAENAGGIHCVKYGVTVDHILALEVVLPDGTLTWLGRAHKAHRRNKGFNLTGVWVGSEGTLGVITQAVVRVLPKPAMVRTYLAAFSQTRHATDAVSAIIQAPVHPSALGFMDAFTVRAVNEAFGVGFPSGSEAVLLIETDGSPEKVLAAEKELLAILNRFSVQEVRVGESEAERTALWKARKGTVAAYGRYYPAFFLNDCVIPRSRLTEMIEKIHAIAASYDTPIANVFHAGDGNLHPHLMFDSRHPEQMDKALRAGEEILRACLAVGGVLSGEHGIGIEKSSFMSDQFSADDLNRMIGVKCLLDPMGLSNPGKVFPVRRTCGEVSKSLSHHMLATGEIWI